MQLAILAGGLFFIRMLIVKSEVMLLIVQCFNAIMVGTLAGIGMIYFQDLMPGQAGSATTLYTNTVRVGWIGR